MKILVTGANGQLGNEMRIVSRQSDTDFLFTDVCQSEGQDTVFLDITDSDAVREIVSKNDVRIIVNCAAYTNVDAADSYVFESNHDVSMLQMGKYPWNIKRRILSDVGHVSNEDAAVAMSDVVAEKPTQIYLAHLSKDNNMKELARMSVTQTLESCGIITGEYLNLHDTDAEKPTALVTV